MGDITLGIKWSEVEVQPTMLPEGEYILQLLGGKDDNGRTTVSTSVADGESVGKRFTFSYPNFNEQAWGLPEFKRLTVALGVDIEDGETPTDYLNRVAGGTFAIKIFHQEFTDNTTGEKRKSAKPRLSSVRPA